MLKILHITPAYKPAYIYGGPTISVSRLCEAQSQLANVKVDVFTTTANGKEELQVPINSPIPLDGVEVYYFNRQTKDHTHFSLGLLKKLFVEVKKYDIIHIHSWWNTVAVLSAFIAVLRQSKVILSPRGMFSDFSFQNKSGKIKKIIHQVLGRYILPKTILHATSQKEWKECQAIISNWKGFTLGNFTTLGEVVNHSSEITITTTTLTFLGRLHPVKNIPLLFESLAKLDQDQIQLQLIGEGERIYQDFLHSEIDRLQLQHQVKFVGAIHGDEKFNYLAQSDIVVLVSETENFANVIIEALSVGTPVLVSDNVGVADYILEHNLGWVCKTNDRDSLVDTLQSAIQDTEKRAYIRMHAPRQIQEDFAPNQLAQKYIDQYHRFI